MQLSKQDEFQISKNDTRNPYPASGLEVSVKDRWHTFSTPAWRVSPSELWYFDPHHNLYALHSDGSRTQVSPEPLWPSGCIWPGGELSVSEPHRFLAVCNGTHFYTDGDLDNIFGFTRIVLLDVPSHRVLARIKAPAYTSVALSPDGKLIAVLHKLKLKLYRIN